MYEKDDLEHKVTWAVRRSLVFADDVVHVLVAVALLITALFMLINTASNLLNTAVSSILLVINDVLFVLIIMELLWTIIRYLRREEFSIQPFIVIGIISSLRRILMLEAQMSMETKEGYSQLVELGVCTGITLVLVISYYLVNRVERPVSNGKT
jgi:uncharacterized membrane protein (DUF373 family)